MNVGRAGVTLGRWMGLMVLWKCDYSRAELVFGGGNAIMAMVLELVRCR